MTPAEIIEFMAEEGVVLEISTTGHIKATGDQAVIDDGCRRSAITRPTFCANYSVSTDALRCWRCWRESISPCLWMMTRPIP